jgi:hypothetical protein
MKLSLTLAVLFCSVFLFAQETTGILKGVIKDANNNPIPFASVLIQQKATGIHYATQSQQDGYYEFNQLQPANDYEAKVSYVGFNVQIVGSIQIQLGKNTILDFTLVSALNQLDNVEIKNSAAKKGNEKRLKIDVITNLPSANRSIQDATRLLPEANLNSFGGANYRFNNLSIDGSATNDVLGFQ